MSPRARTTIMDVVNILADAASIGLFVTAVIVIAGLFTGHV